MSVPDARSMLVLGGSSMYVLLLLRAMADGGQLGNYRRITLYGRDEQRLAFIAEVGRTLAGNCDIGYATDIDAALAQGHDIVFNQIRFGGLAARNLDERTATACGMAADETLGIVGVSNAIRTIAGMQPLICAALRAPKRARWINFTNPCSIVTQHLVNMLGEQAALGICDFPTVFRNRIAAFIGAAQDDIEIGYFGLNHFAFVHAIRVGRHDVLAQVLAHSCRFELAIGAQRHLEYLVVPSWDMVYDPEPMLARQRQQANRAAKLIDIEQQCQHLLDGGQRDPAAYFALLAQRDCDWYRLAVLPLLAQCGQPDAGGAIVNLPMGDVFGLGIADTVVETNAMVGADGAHAMPLPEAVRHSALFDDCRTMKRAEQLLLAGITRRDPQLVMRACLANPMIRSSARIEQYFDALRAADPGIARFFQSSQQDATQ
jgi:6-phospho-beta-glucosidase